MMSRRFQGRSWLSARGCAVVLAADLLFLASSAGAVAPSGSPPSFAPARFSTMKSPQSVAIGDLNADGRPDLVAAHGGIGELRHIRAVSVLLNRGRGKFAAARAYPTGKAGDKNGSWSVAIGDLTGDGTADLATANPGGRSVSVLFNRGDGTFQPSVNYALGREPWDVAIEDLNADGTADVATANPNTVSVLLNRGDGTLNEKLEYPTGRDTWAFAVGDLNGDGQPDLATASHRPSTVTVLVNRGDGSFEPGVAYRTGSGPTSLAMADMNGDGRPDVVTANGSSSPGGEDDWVDTVSVLLNRGDGTFRPTRDYRAPIDDRLEFNSVAIGDLNGDSRPDVATADGAHHAVSVLLNRGNGRFRRRLDYEWIDLVNRSVGYGARAIVVGDVNGDRRPDVITPRFRYISVFINKPGLCTVPAVEGMALTAAKRVVARARCHVGRLRRTDSFLKAGYVSSQTPQPGTMLRRGGKVNLWVSNGRRPS